MDFIRSGGELKNLPYIGSNRFFEHAQNLIGCVKKEVGNKKNLGGKREVTIIIQNKNYVMVIELYLQNIYVILLLYNIILYYY